MFIHLQTWSEHDTLLYIMCFNTCVILKPENQTKKKKFFRNALSSKWWIVSAPVSFDATARSYSLLRPSNMLDAWYLLVSLVGLVLLLSPFRLPPGPTWTSQCMWFHPQTANIMRKTWTKPELFLLNYSIYYF